MVSFALRNSSNTMNATQFLAADGSASAPGFSFQNETNMGFYRQSNNVLSAAIANSLVWQVTNSRCIVPNQLSIGAAVDVLLNREAANTLNLKNGANAQTLKIYSNTTNFTSLTGTGIGTYNGITTAGNGVPVIVAYNRLTGQTGAVASIATFTPAADGSFEVSANLLATTAVGYSINCQVSWTDESNTARTQSMDFNQTTGGLAVVLTNANAPIYNGIPQHIRAKANTAITISTVGTFTNITYNVEGIIKQVA